MFVYLHNASVCAGISLFALHLCCFNIASHVRRFAADSSADTVVLTLLLIVAFFSLPRSPLSSSSLLSPSPSLPHHSLSTTTLISPSLLLISSLFTSLLLSPSPSHSLLSSLSLLPTSCLIFLSGTLRSWR